MVVDWLYSPLKRGKRWRKELQEKGRDKNTTEDSEYIRKYQIQSGS